MKISLLILSALAGAALQNASAATLYSQDFESATAGSSAQGPGGFVQIGNVGGSGWQVQGGGDLSGISVTAGVDANGAGGGQALFALWDHSTGGGWGTWNQFTIYGLPGAGTGTVLDQILVSMDIFISGSEGSTTPLTVSFQNNGSSQNYVPTLVNDQYTHVQFTLNQGTLGSGTGVDPTASFNLQVSHGAGGFGFDANNLVRLDNITVSIVPEPSVLTLAGLGSAMMLRRLLRRA